MNAIIDQICDEFESAWRNGHRGNIEPLLEQCAGDDRKALLYELVCLEIELLTTNGETPQASDYRGRFPEDRTIIDAAFAALGKSESTKPQLVHVRMRQPR